MATASSSYETLLYCVIVFVIAAIALGIKGLVLVASGGVLWFALIGLARQLRTRGDIELTDEEPEYVGRRR